MYKVLADRHQKVITKEQQAHIEEIFAPIASKYKTTIRFINGAGTSFVFDMSNELTIVTNSAFPESHTIDKGDNALTYSKKYHEIKFNDNIMEQTHWKTLIKRIARFATEILEEIESESKFIPGKADAFVKQFAEQEVQANQRKIRDVEDSLRQAKGYIESAKIEIIKYSKARDEKLAQLATLRTMPLEALYKKITDEFEAVLSLPLVKSIKQENGILFVELDKVYAYHDVTGDRYYIGEFILRIDMKNAEVRFQNQDNKRKSHWGNDCHHPHIDDATWGYACLGNTESTIAELCYAKEYYALVTILINFLESVNTSDVAGAFIKSWDMVDENGNVIQEGHSFEDPCNCYDCDETNEAEDMCYIVSRVDVNGNDHDGFYVCETCSDDYPFSEYGDMRCTDEVYEELKEMEREENRFDIVVEVDEDGEIVEEMRYTEDEADRAGITYLYDDELSSYVTYEVYEKLEQIRNDEEEE